MGGDLVTNELKRISFDEFSKDLARVFDDAVSTGEMIEIEKGEGERVLLIPSSLLKSRPRTEAEWTKFLPAN